MTNEFNNRGTVYHNPNKIRDAVATMQEIQEALVEAGVLKSKPDVTLAKSATDPQRFRREDPLTEAKKDPSKDHTPGGHSIA